MKTTSTDLYFLIKTLSIAERAYFKKYAKRFSDGDTLSLKLFEEIEMQIDKGTEYDEDIIREKLDKIKNANQFSAAKNYLYDLVLKSLLSSQNEKSLDDKLDKYIAQAELLKSKTLFEQSMKMVKKAKKIAYKYEHYTKLYTILQIQKNLYFDNAHPYIEKTQNELFEEELHCLDTLRKKSTIQNLSSQISSLMVNNGLIQGERELKKAKKIMSHPYLKKLSEKETYTFKVFFYHIHTTFNSITANFEKTYEYMKQYLEMVENYPQQIERKAVNLLSVSYNITVVCTYCKKYDEFFYYLERFRSIPERYKILNTEYVKSYIFLSFKLELIVFYQTGQFENGITLAQSIEDKIENGHSNIRSTDILQYYFFISCCYFGAGDFNNSLKWINKILNKGEPEQRLDLYIHTKLFNLVIHYELGNKEHIEYLLKSTDKFLRSRKEVSKLESSVYKHFSNLKSKITKAEIKECFEEFLYILQKIQKSGKEKHSFNFFDYISWAQSKITGKSFEEIKKLKVL